ncbi:uncharacterized protein LOC128558080 [Mercenaria mercenaria]|uniref:uncharacterized protein LOC128558080 n=1 Tax=Mercenaria mercenaria TaxID=6596 RepID=UPI00234EBFC5|nr:uncharacterized protein LOC128558080 [Mercenaria mercenaria]
MTNALVVYTDSEPFRSHITAVRSELSQITKIFSVNRSTMWSFQNLKKVTEIYNLKSYPKRYPNVNPLYTCVTHAKFDLIAKTAQDDIFKTKYIMWLDLGYFRNRKSHNIFHMSKPKYFNDSKIAMNQVNGKDDSISPNTIVRKSLRYVGGGLIYGEKTRVILLVEDFKRAVRYFLSKNEINCEEQILYAMFSKRGRQILKPNVELQLYRTKERKWFYLGDSMIIEENV